MDKLANLASSVLGNPRKAFLVIHKDPPEKADSSKIIEQTEMVLTMLNAGGGVAAGALGEFASAHVLQVQYNPATLAFRATSTERAVQALRQYGDNNMPTQITHPPSITLSVELIFDAVNIKDCFTSDKMELFSVGGVASSLAKLVRDPYTVQPQTNGLLALGMLSKYQRLTFHWSDTTFSGEISETQARYTMFSVAGRPVRSTIQLQIRQQMENKNEKQRWNDKFDKCFGEADVAGNFGRISADQAFGNILNLGF